MTRNTSRAIVLWFTASPAPSQIVHAVSYASGDGAEFHLACDSPWGIVNLLYNARVLTEADSLGHTMTVSLTIDPVDCMSCLVARARR